MSDIKKAYRKLSLVLHPDRNKEEDAEAKFRRVCFFTWKIFALENIFKSINIVN